jgi:hypothetical protein
MRRMGRGWKQSLGGSGRRLRWYIMGGMIHTRLVATSLKLKGDLFCVLSA